MISNSEYIVMLNQAEPDRAKLVTLLNISTEQIDICGEELKVMDKVTERLLWGDYLCRNKRTRVQSKDYMTQK